MYKIEIATDFELLTKEESKIKVVCYSMLIIQVSKYVPDKYNEKEIHCTDSG